MFDFMSKFTFRDIILVIVIIVLIINSVYLYTRPIYRGDGKEHFASTESLSIEAINNLGAISKMIMNDGKITIPADVTIDGNLIIKNNICRTRAPDKGFCTTQDYWDF